MLGFMLQKSNLKHTAYNLEEEAVAKRPPLPLSSLQYLVSTHLSSLRVRVSLPTYTHPFYAEHATQ
jgi:hypothetical protein